MTLRVITIVTTLLSATAAYAEPAQQPTFSNSPPCRVIEMQRLPVPKLPGPAAGYLSSGSFCTPSQDAQEAIPKPPNGTCPFDWTSSGSYCLHPGSERDDWPGHLFFLDAPSFVRHPTDGVSSKPEPSFADTVGIDHHRLFRPGNGTR
jgi:hypothetical protein